MIKNIHNAIVILLILVGWKATVVLFNIPHYLIPSPEKVVAVIYNDITAIINNTIVTALEALAGFIIATILSVFIAVWFTVSSYTRNLFMPFLIGLKAIPIIAIAPLLVIWFGNEFFSKALMSSIISFFPIVVNLVRGFGDVPASQIEYLKSVDATKTQMFWYLRIPNSLPYLFAGLKIASTLSVVGAIVGETVGSNQGLGHMILVAGMRIDTPLLFAGIIFASILGILFYNTLEKLETRIIKWGPLNE